MGAFPIESQTSCADEWICNGQTGLIVPPEDPGPVGDAILRAALDDELVDNADRENQHIVAERLERHNLHRKIMEMYEQIIAQRRSCPKVT